MVNYLKLLYFGFCAYRIDSIWQKNTRTVIISVMHCYSLNALHNFVPNWHLICHVAF